MRLQDKVVIVTGGGSGAGEAIVASCVAEGAQVIAIGRDAEKLGAACKKAGKKRPIKKPMGKCKIIGCRRPRNLMKSGVCAGVAAATA